MIDTTHLTGTLLLDTVVQSTAIILVGLLVARYVVRQPARRHAVLTLAMIGALVGPLASEIVRRGGWGLLEPREVAVETRATALEDAPPTFEPARDEHHRSTEAGDEFEPQDMNSDGRVDRRGDAGSTGVASKRFDSPASKPTSSRSIGDPRGGSLSIMPLVVMAAFAVWALASALVAWRLLGGVIAGRRLAAGSAPCFEPAVAAALAAACNRLGLDRAAVDVYESPAVRCPVIWCWGQRPRMLLPAEAVSHWSAAQWTPIFCHELAHWKRRDHLAALVAELVCCLMPWQVLAWWAKRHLEHASEQACDDWAVAAGHSATDYAEILLGLVAEPDPALALAAVRRSSGLAARVRHILTQAVPNPRLGRLWAMTVLCITATGIGTAALCQRGVARAERNPVGKKSSETDTTKATRRANVSTSKPAAAMPDKGGRTSTETPGGSRVPPIAPPSEKDTEGQVRHWKTSGKVLTADGKPIAGAAVFWDIVEYPRSGWPSTRTLARTRTDAEGHFTIEADYANSPHAANALIVRATGFGLRSAVITNLQNPEKPLEIRMEPQCLVEGTVFSPNGEPIVGAPVRLSSLSHFSDPSASPKPDKPWVIQLSPGEIRQDDPRPYWPDPVETDGEGRFRFEDAVPRNAVARVTVDAAGFAPTTVAVAGPDSHAKPEAEYREPNFTLVLENPYVVDGRFLDEETGEPIANVRLEVEPGTYGRARLVNQTTTVTSNEEGRYTLRLGSADYYMTHVIPPQGYPAVRQSFSSREIRQLAGADRKLSYEVKLRPGLVLNGRVVDAETGDPVPGAEVQYKPLVGRKLGINNDFESVKTADDGTFEITGTDGKGFLLVDAPERGFYRLAVKDSRIPYYQEGIYPHAMLEVDVPTDGQAEPFVLKLHRGPELVIQPLGPDGKPVKHIRGAYAGQAFDGFSSAEQRPNGMFRLNAVEPGRMYRVYLFSPDAMAGAVAEVEVPADGKPVEVTLQPCATIRGRYVYEGGAPAPEVTNFTRFRMYPDEKPEGNAAMNLPFYGNFSGQRSKGRVTDNEGRFELDGIVPGAFMYLDLNFAFDNGERSYEVGILKPGEVRDVGDLVIRER